MIENKKILGLICARGGSKGIPRKNLRLLGGKPLIGWSIAAARACSLIDRLVVSTEDTEIARIARELGAETPFMRPAELARDDSPEWPVWQHALRETEALSGFRADYLVVLPPTSPFRSGEDITKSVKMIHAGDADIVISVAEARRNPYFNMVEINDGYAALCKIPDKKVSRRQEAPHVYDVTTVLYTSKSTYVRNAGSLFEGRVKALIVPELRAIDIDTELDLKFAEFILSEGLVAHP